MTASKLPDPNETLALLETLKRSVRDLAGREEKLTAEHRLRCAAEQKTFDARTAEQQAASTERLANAQAAFATAKQYAQTRYERRKQRIHQAHSNARQRVLERISKDDGHRKFKIQENSLEAERHRDADLAAAIATRDEFHQKVVAASETAAGLDRAAYDAFRGFPRFRRLLSPDRPWPEINAAADETVLLEEFQRAQADATEALRRFERLGLARVFRFVPIGLMAGLALGFALAIGALRYFAVAALPASYTGIAAAMALLVLALAAYALARHQVAPRAEEIARLIARARKLLDAAHEKSELRLWEAQQRIARELAETTRSLNQQWREIVKLGVHARGSLPIAIDEKAGRAHAHHEKLHAAALRQLERELGETLARLRRQQEEETRQLESAHAANEARLNAELRARQETLAAEWKSSLQPVYDRIRTANTETERLFPDWTAARWADWKPPADFANAAQFGRLEVDVPKLADLPKNARLVLPGPAEFSLPLALTYPLRGSLLFEAGQAGNEEAIGAMNNILFRLLATTPAGKVSFTIFDPVGLGQNFAGLMHLADYEESNINSRIWTQTTQLEEKLAELNEHMEKVIQMYLRNEYATITEYNAQAGAIAEKYHVLVIASFPVNFSDTAARRLRNIAASGARCGVYAVVHWDQRHPVPPEFVPDELRKNCVRLVRAADRFDLGGTRIAGTRLLLDPPPSPEFATDFLRRVGESSKGANRVEVPFEHVAPADGQLWTEETSEELRVAIGRTGASKLQYLEIGKGTRQHALIAGKTGSGKSTLFHVIINNLALWCSPEQVEFYLVDFKKGVEFKCYATRHLPHARVVAIESDRQFGLSVLQRVDEELRRRGDLFRQLGVQDLPGYKRAGGTEPMPRSLLIVDEFQEFFVEEDRVSQNAAVLLDRIVRQGRAFGIHVLLGSQTLGGAYTLARATLGQMVIRIALQCNEADAYLIMDQDNPAPRLLSRPGEGIYNDAAGSIEGNSPFQTVWLPDDIRDQYLAQVRTRADRRPGAYPGPFVFEGNAPADIAHNLVLRQALASNPAQPPPMGRWWLGAPNAIKGPTEVVFKRQSGNNLLIVGQSEVHAVALVSAGLISLAAQYPEGTAHFVLLDGTPPGFPEREYLERVIYAMPHEVLEGNAGNLAQIMARLADDLKQRGAGDAAGAPETFVIIHALQNFKKLRLEDEFSLSSPAPDALEPASVLLNLINEGPPRGMHVIITCDTYNNVNRYLSRKTLTEFEMRVLFQMSASDSASLIDAPDAGTLGMHRALYYNDREGYTETFRPYALPDTGWLEEAGRMMKT